MKIPRLIYLYPLALAHVFWTFTVGLFKAESRLRIFRLAQETLFFKSPFPQVPVMELVQDLPTFTILEPKAASGNVSLLELNALCWLAQRQKAKNLFEFGTFDGRTALNLVAHSAAEARLHTLDLPASELDKTQLAILPVERAFVEKASSGLRFQNLPYASQIIQLFGDSATFDFSPYYGKMEFVFIDASHAYEYVKSDTNHALKLLHSNGGVLVWHDYDTSDWPGVRRALHEFYRNDRRFRNLQKIQGTNLAVLELTFDSLASHR